MAAKASVSAPERPSLLLSLTDLSRSGLEAARLLFKLNRLIKSAPRGDGHPVLALPGYGGADGSMAAIRYVLSEVGYEPYALDLGRNFESREDRIMRVEDAVAFRDKMTGMVVERLEQIHRETGEKVTMIGWSMGGLYALDASRAVPHLTRQVVTLGSPFGDPRGTALFHVMRKLNGSEVPIEEQDFNMWNDKARLDDNIVPIKVLHSHRDGIVGSGIQKLPQHPSVDHIQVNSSHIGFAVNPEVLQTVTRIIQ